MLDPIPIKLLKEML